MKYESKGAVDVPPQKCITPRGAYLSLS